MSKKHCLIAALIAVLLPALSLAEPVTVFLRRDGALYAVQREVGSQAGLEAAIAALAAGPMGEEIAAGVNSAIPAGTRAIASMVEGRIVVEFSDDLVATGLDDARLEAIYEQVAWTAAAYAPDSSVRLTSGGLPLWSHLAPAAKIAPRADVSSATTGLPLAAGPGAALAGRKVSLSPGHGLRWSGSGWGYDRPVYCAPLSREDHHNIDLTDYLNTYLAQDGATTLNYRCLDKGYGNHPQTGEPWWYMSGSYWLQHIGYPCNVYASSTGDCTLGSGADESSDNIRSRPYASDYDNSTIHIAMHTNGYTGDCAGSGCPNGTCTYYDATTDHAAWATISRQLGQAVNSSIVDAIRTGYGDATWRDRGTIDSDGDFAETRIPDRAAILIELAFHDSCDRDGLYLRDNFFRSATMWATYKGVCDYFGAVPTYGMYSDEYVSDTIPAVMMPGQAYNVSITLRNRGVLWNAERGFALGAVGDADPFTATARVPVSGEVGPGQTCTFNFTLTAPAASGNYTTDWRMVREGVSWFGATHIESIHVGTDGPFPPSIDQQPGAQLVPQGATATFGVVAAGDPPLSYLWSKDGTPLLDGPRVSGSSSSTLQIIYAASIDQGSYQCRVSNPYGDADSAPAALTVTPNLYITESRSGGQHFSQYSESGTWANAANKSTASGTTAGIDCRYGSTYRSIAGLKRATFRASLPATGRYECFATWPANGSRRSPILHRVTYAGGSADVDISQAATANQWVSLGTYQFNAGTNTGSIEMSNEHIDASGSMYADAMKWEYRGNGIAAPTISGHPAPRSVCPGTSTAFTVSGAGTGPLFYRWRKDGSDLSEGADHSGVTTATLTVSTAEAADVGAYACEVSNVGGSATSNPAALSLKAATSVSAQPEAQAIGAGGTASFSVTAAGSGGLAYAWQKDRADVTEGGKYTGTATPTLTVSGADASDAGLYRCVVTAECGSINSDEAALTIAGPAAIPGDFDGDRDVDQGDFGHLQACLTEAPPGQVIADGCGDGDLNTDQSIDQEDIVIFLNCVSGPGHEGDPECDAG